MTVREFIRSNRDCSVKLRKTAHRGPGLARNFAAAKTRGTILVFADSDMTFEHKFLEKLTLPIKTGKSKGTFNTDEEVANWDKPLSRCWNYFGGLPGRNRIKAEYGQVSPVFRAILKSEFLKSGGFTPIGYTDDWTLSRKLGYKADLAAGAKSYHYNPETFPEVYRQARWIGKNEFISGTLLRRLFNLFRYSPLYQIPRSLILSVKYRQLLLIPFSAVYSLGVTVSVVKSFFRESKYK